MSLLCFTAVMINTEVTRQVIVLMTSEVLATDSATGDSDEKVQWRLEDLHHSFCDNQWCK